MPTHAPHHPSDRSAAITLGALFLVGVLSVYWTRPAEEADVPPQPEEGIVTQSNTKDDFECE